VPRKLAALAAVGFALAAPAAADAARPIKGTFYNGSASRGLFAETKRYYIERLQFFCTSDKNYPVRQSRYSVRDRITVHGDGSFSYKGIAYRYGAEGSWVGNKKVRLKGRFTSSRRVKIKRTLEGCGTATVTANATG
jgi:hypothetical protein